MDSTCLNPYLGGSAFVWLSISGKNPSRMRIFALPTASLAFSVIALASLVSTPAFAQQTDAALELSPCELRLPGTGLTAPAECGWFEVAENPDDPDGKKINLRVARVPAQGRSAEPDPLVLFAGGPGQAATEAWLIVAPAFRKLAENRDVLLIDQRGTGQSNSLKCKQIGLDESLSLGWEDLERTTQECLDELPGDPRFYTTTIAMQDYDQVRAALGYEQLNLFGVSYGTRAAQVYLRLFPDNTSAPLCWTASCHRHWPWAVNTP